jgi:hypothetical protein
MSSLIRIESSRANGAKSHGPVTPEGKIASAENSKLSTGPVTPEGKARSSRNAITHGMLAAAIVLDNEGDTALFTSELSDLEDEHQPRTPTEIRHIRVMAVANWRQMRIWSLEKQQLDDETARQMLAHPEDHSTSPIGWTSRAFRALSDETRSVELLSRYELRYDRQYQRALTAFRSHRASQEHKLSKRSEPNLG